jgi:hypothetical protein
MPEKKYFIEKSETVIICNFPNILKGMGSLNSNFLNSMMAIIRKNNAYL